ncbi:MAG: SidA/IucD/PvdA family monooxygenase [Methylovirgula sp.]
MFKSLDVAVIGAGPYGLSLAAHLRSRGVDFRIFGEPMSSWKENMPQGMLLKSYPWASNLSDVESRFTVRQFCAERGIPYDDSLTPLPLETFVSYGEAFQARFAPQVERKLLVSVEPIASGLRARFDDGEVVDVRRMVLAVGLSAFKYMPAIANQLPSEMVSHSSDHGPLDNLKGKNVVVVGSGSSATDLSALLHEKGISVSLIARDNNLNFASTPRQRTAVERVVAPTSGIGNGWTMSVCADAPWVVHQLPEKLRVRLANSKALGPLGGAFMKDRIIGKVPLWLGRTLDKADLRNGKIQLHLTTADGAKDILRVDHVIFATGYKIDIGRLPFLHPDLVARMQQTGTAPLLSSHYESSIPGLHFIGPSSASSFGPVCRFVFGTRHPSRHLARYLPSVLGRRAVRLIDALPVDSTVLP